MFALNVFCISSFTQKITIDGQASRNLTLVVMSQSVLHSHQQASSKTNVKIHQISTCKPEHSQTTLHILLLFQHRSHVYMNILGLLKITCETPAEYHTKCSNPNSFWQCSYSTEFSKPTALIFFNIFRYITGEMQDRFMAISYTKVTSWKLKEKWLCYLDGWLNHYPCRQHQIWIQRLSSNSEINPTIAVTGPNVLISTC